MYVYVCVYVNVYVYGYVYVYVYVYVCVYVYVYVYVNVYVLVYALFNFALEYANRRVQVNRDGLKLNGTHQLLAYADAVNILGGSIHTLKENAEALVAATREIGLEVSADKTKYMVMS